MYDYPRVERFTCLQCCLREIRNIHVPNHAEIKRNTCLSTYDDSVHYTRALTDVKNMLHAALSKLVRHREGETYCELRVVRERRSPGAEGA